MERFEAIFPDFVFWKQSVLHTIVPGLRVRLSDGPIEITFSLPNLKGGCTMRVRVWIAIIVWEDFLPASTWRVKVPKLPSRVPVATGIREGFLEASDDKGEMVREGAGNWFVRKRVDLNVNRVSIVKEARKKARVQSICRVRDAWRHDPWNPWSYFMQLYESWSSFVHWFFGSIVPQKDSMTCKKTQQMSIVYSFRFSKRLLQIEPELDSFESTWNSFTRVPVQWAKSRLFKLTSPDWWA